MRGLALIMIPVYCILHSSKRLSAVGTSLPLVLISLPLTIGGVYATENSKLVEILFCFCVLCIKWDPFITYTSLVPTCLSGVHPSTLKSHPSQEVSHKGGSQQPVALVTDGMTTGCLVMVCVGNWNVNCRPYAVIIGTFEQRHASPISMLDALSLSHWCIILSEMYTVAP